MVGEPKLVLISSVVWQLVLVVVGCGCWFWLWQGVSVGLGCGRVWLLVWEELNSEKGHIESTHQDTDTHWMVDSILGLRPFIHKNYVTHDFVFFENVESSLSLLLFLFLYCALFLDFSISYFLFILASCKSLN